MIHARVGNDAGYEWLTGRNLSPSRRALQASRRKMIGPAQQQQCTRAEYRGEREGALLRHATVRPPDDTSRETRDIPLRLRSERALRKPGERALHLGPVPSAVFGVPRRHTHTAAHDGTGTVVCAALFLKPRFRQTQRHFHLASNDGSTSPCRGSPQNTGRLCL